MLTTVQPSRAPTSVIGSGSAKVSARADVAELALRVVVVDEQGEGGPVAGGRPLEHLAVAAGVAGGEDRAAAQLGLDVADLGGALVGAADEPAGPAQAGVPPSSAVGTKLVVDQRADDGLGRHAVQLLADRPDELGAAAGDDADGEVAAAQLVDQLEHRLVGVASSGRPSVGCRAPAMNVADPGGELLGRDALEQPGQGHGDPLQPELADRGRVSPESSAANSGVSREARVRVRPAPSARRRRSRAGRRSAARTTACRRCRSTRPAPRRARRAPRRGTPRRRRGWRPGARTGAGSSVMVGLSGCVSARVVVRTGSPTWLMPVSIIWGRRAAGR